MGRRLEAALIRKGVHPDDVTKTLGGRAIQTWYRWIHGEQEGGWKDIAEMALFLDMTPNELMLESEEVLDATFNEDDVVQLESLRAMLREMTRLAGKKPAERPVSIVHQHVAALLGAVKAGTGSRKSPTTDTYEIIADDFDVKALSTASTWIHTMGSYANLCGFNFNDLSDNMAKEIG